MFPLLSTRHNVYSLICASTKKNTNLQMSDCTLNISHRHREYKLKASFRPIRQFLSDVRQPMDDLVDPRCTHVTHDDDMLREHGVFSIQFMHTVEDNPIEKRLFTTNKIWRFFSGKNFNYERIVRLNLETLRFHPGLSFLKSFVFGNERPFRKSRRIKNVCFDVSKTTVLNRSL
jgi:hypothetical protein